MESKLRQAVPRKRARRQARGQGQLERTWRRKLVGMVSGLHPVGNKGSQME